MNGKRIAAALCALAVVVSTAGGLPFGGLGLFDTAITASAVETTDYTIDMSQQGYENEQEVQSAQDPDNIVTVTFGKGTSKKDKPKYYDTDTAVRVYRGNKMTVKAESVITSIEITFGSNDGGNTISADTGTYSEDGKWTGDGSATSVTFTVVGISGKNKYRRIQELKATVETYTVTWNNADGTPLEEDEKVTKGATPSYDGETPTKADDENNTYTFSGWSDGTNTYGVNDSLPEVSADVTYTATFEATAKPIDPAYTITIPATVSIDGGTAEVTASDVTLPDGASINISIDGSNTDANTDVFNAKNEAGDSTVQYTIKNGETVVTDGGTAMTFNEGGTQSLTFTKTSEPTYAGKYTETLTFAVSVQS